MATLLKYKPELSQDTLDSVLKTFKLFQDENGKLNCDNLLTSLKDLKFDEQEPVIYDIIDEVCSSNRMGLTYDEFVDKLNETLQDRGSEKSTERTYGLFVEDPKGTLTYEVLKKVAEEAGDNASEEEIRKTFNYASSNGNDIPYEEFHTIMTKSFENKNEY